MNILLAVVTASVLAAPVAGESASSRTLIALSVDAKSLSVEVRSGLTQAVSDELRRLEPGVKVYVAEDLVVALGAERERALAACNDEGFCLTEFAGALGADELLSTRVTRLAGGLFSSPWLVSVRKVDGKTGRTLSSGQVQVCGAESELPAAVRAAVWKASGLQPRGVSGECNAQGTSGVLAVGGGVLLLAGAAGVVSTLGTRTAFEAQQAPGSPATVTRAQGTVTNTVFLASVGVGVVGAVGLGLGLVGLLSPGDTKVALVPLAGGAALTWGGAL